MKKTFLLLLWAALSASSCSHQNSSEAVPSVVANAPLAYVLEEITGNVLVQSAGNPLPDPAIEGQTVQPGDEITTQAGAEATLTLNENTLFHLSENSDLKVTQLARNDSQGFVSRLSLAAGKVLSEVEKLSDTGSTFEVESGGVICGVRGTSFEVEKQDSGVQNTTYNGVVALQKGNSSQTVEAGQHGEYSNGQGAFLPNRPLTPEEKAHYEDWKAKRDMVRGKCHQRLANLRALDKMPPQQKEAILQQVKMNGKDGQRSVLELMKTQVAQPNQGGPNPSQPNGQRPANVQPERPSAPGPGTGGPRPPNQPARAPQPRMRK